MITKLEDRSHAGPCNTADGADCTVPGEIDLAKLPVPVRLWLMPIRDQMPVINATWDKPLGELTIPEIIAWAAVSSYFVASGYIAGRLAANLALAALRGPYRR